MKTHHISLVLLLAVGTVLGQPQPFSIGLDASVKEETYSFTDPGGRLVSDIAQVQVRWGLSARWYKSRFWTAEAGVSFVQTNAPTIDYKFPTPGGRLPFYDMQPSKPQFLVRAYYAPIQIDFGQQQMIIGPYVGGSFATYRVNIDELLIPGIGFSRNYEGFAPDPVKNAVEVISSRQVTVNPNRFTTHAELGAHITVYSAGRWHLRCQGSWHQGFGNTLLSQVTYTSSFDPTTVNRATITSNGSGWVGNIMIGYMFGRPGPWFRYGRESR